MINLALKSPLKSNHWKFFDDVTISETICTGERSSIQWSLIKYRIGYGKQHEFESKEVSGDYLESQYISVSVFLE